MASWQKRATMLGAERYPGPIPPRARGTKTTRPQHQPCEGPFYPKGTRSEERKEGFPFSCLSVPTKASPFLRNKNAALPVRAQKNPLTLSGLKKMGPGWRQRPRTFAPQASVTAASVRDAVGHEYTCFMRRGEDARLHERFSGTQLLSEDEGQLPP